jgi:parvulin-like peptidyl-prolyl isomerase
MAGRDGLSVISLCLLFMPIARKQGLALAFLGTLLAGAGAQTAHPADAPGAARPLDRVVAFVDGEILTAADLEFWVWEARLNNPGLDAAPSADVKAEVLARMVDEVLMSHWAESNVRIIVQEEIDHNAERAWERLRGAAPTETIFQGILREAGLTPETVRRQLAARERRLWLIRTALAARLNVRVTQLDRSELKKDEAAERPVRLRTRHILLRCPPGAEDVQSSQTLLRALAIRREILAGMPFAQAAELFSEDKATRADGGQLGWLSVSEMEASIAEAASRLRTGEITAPIRTRQGWHLVQLLDYDTPASLFLLRRVEEAHRELLAEQHARKTVRIQPSLAREASAPAPQ